MKSAMSKACSCKLATACPPVRALTARHTSAAGRWQVASSKRSPIATAPLATVMRKRLRPSANTPGQLRASTSKANSASKGLQIQGQLCLEGGLAKHCHNDALKGLLS
eukprot:8159971-Alexandrium_andersonii.AAC.1